MQALVFGFFLALGGRAIHYTKIIALVFAYIQVVRVACSFC